MSTAFPLVISELHVDDLELERGADFRDADRLVRSIADAAERAGARLGFRFRAAFARQAARAGHDNPLRALVARGHEVGTHAHGRGFAKAARAVAACGVPNRGATPGMVQAGDKVDKLWREAHKLGFAWVVDHAPFRAWAYAGHLPWRPGAAFRADQPPLGPVMLDTAADPFAWGLLRREGRHVRHRFGLDSSNFERLEALLAAHACPLPSGDRGFFVFALHEHNFCPEGSLVPTDAALEAFADFLGRHEVTTAGQLASSLEVSTHGPAHAAPPRPIRFARKLRIATRPARNRVRGRTGEEVGPFVVTRGPQRLHATWLGPPEPRGLLLLSHAGLQGGTKTLLHPFGVDPKWLTAEDLAVVAFDRSGTGRSPATTSLTPGNTAHVRDFRAVLDAIRSRLGAGIPLGVLSFSSGILPPLRVGSGFDFLLDGEAPADRYSLRPPRGAGVPKDELLSSLSLDDDRAWEGREPAKLLGTLACPYHRFQAELDHVHGRLDVHAQLMLEAARAGSCTEVRANGAEELLLLPGRLHAHGQRIRSWILQALEAC